MGDWLALQSAARPDVVAVKGEGLRITYAELDQRAAIAARGLAGAGVRRDDRVAVLAPNSLALVEVVHALPRLGAVQVPINLRLRAHEIASQLRDAGVRHVLAHPEVAGLAAEAAAMAGRPAPLPLPLPPGPPFGAVDEHALDDPHTVIYTSGTTGQPKGAVLTYGNHLASAAGSAFNLGLYPDDRWLACLPLFHVGGLSIVLRSVLYGTCLVLAPRFDEEEVARTLREERVTLLSLVPTMLRRLLAAEGGAAPADLRAVLIGGGPVPRELLAEALDRRYPVVQTYGLTETASQVATLAVHDALKRLGSAGRPLLTAQLRVDAVPGEAGEILVRGPVLSPGYLAGDGLRPAAGADGWFHTGDLGRLDEDGFLYVLDRREDLIVSGGENVYPAEVEAVLLAHPAVRAAGVVGVSDPEWGQTVAAAVVAADGAAPSDLIAFARSRLAGYKVPRRVLLVDALPETASGKVRRHLVRRLFEGDGPPDAPA